ncbi:MAG: sporulation integral membrane protein YtvI [Roseburia sp.]
MKKGIPLLGITLAVYAGMRWLLPLVVPFLFAGLFAILLHKPVDFLQKKLKIPRPIGGILVLVAALALVLVPLGWLLYKGVNQLVLLASDYPMLLHKAEELWGECCNRVEELGVCRAEVMEQWGEDHMSDLASSIKEKAVPSIMNYSYLSVKQVGLFLGKCVVAFVAAVLMLNDYDYLRRKIARSVPGRFLLRMWSKMRRAGGTYLKAQFLIMCMVIATCVAGLFLAGNPYALLVGILIGLCDALPFIGTGIVLVPWLLIKAFQEDYKTAVILGCIYIACSFIREFSEPKLVGKGLGVHPLAVLLSVYVGMRLFGAAGILLGPVSAFLIWQIWQID